MSSQRRFRDDFDCLRATNRSHRTDYYYQGRLLFSNNQPPPRSESHLIEDPAKGYRYKIMHVCWFTDEHAAVRLEDALAS